jgi:hypothetical protein
VRPALPTLTLAVAALLLASCGSAGDGGGTPAPPPVSLSISAPGDLAVVHDDHVDLQGTVRPASATVTVMGRRAAVSGGTFRATVRLEAGTNVIDVLASAGRARPALTAIRVKREVSVQMPDLVGQPVPDATRQLGDLGLEVEVDERDGLFDRVLPGDPSVCETRPEAGEQVDPGEKVRIEASKSC